MSRENGRPVCEWCGDVGRSADPLMLWTMTPPLAVCQIEQALMHAGCADAAPAFAVA